MQIILKKWNKEALKYEETPLPSGTNLFTTQAVTPIIASVPGVKLLGWEITSVAVWGNLESVDIFLHQKEEAAQ